MEETPYESNGNGQECSHTGGWRHQLHAAKSLNEALQLAKKLHDDDNNNNNNDTDSKEEELQCWIAGGERLYIESLKHPSAQELHLSEVDLNIEITTTADSDSDSGNNRQQNIAFFPARYRWDIMFKLASKQEYKESVLGDLKTPGFTYYVYEKIRRNR